jgi:hypothetical protein
MLWPKVIVKVALYSIFARLNIYAAFIQCLIKNIQNVRYINFAFLALVKKMQNQIIANKNLAKYTHAKLNTLVKNLNYKNVDK